MFHGEIIYLYIVEYVSHSTWFIDFEKFKKFPCWWQYNWTHSGCWLTRTATYRKQLYFAGYVPTHLRISEKLFAPSEPTMLDINAENCSKSNPKTFSSHLTCSYRLQFGIGPSTQPPPGEVLRQRNYSIPIPDFSTFGFQMRLEFLILLDIWYPVPFQFRIETFAKKCKASLM